MLDIDATVLVTFILVWILVLVLTRVFFKPLKKVMDDLVIEKLSKRFQTNTYSTLKNHSGRFKGAYNRARVRALASSKVT